MPNETQAAKKDSTFIICIGVVMALLVFAFWLATPLVVSSFIGGEKWESRGQFGDVFGSINALFSGVAFVGVIVAILLQKQELEFQRQELQLTRAEMKASTDALNKTMYAQSFKVALDIIESPEAIHSRGMVLRYRDNLSKPPSEWAQTGIDAADITARNLESVGTMIRKGQLPKDYILDTWSVAIDRTWQCLDNYIEHRRAERNDPYLGLDFERLAVEARKFLEENPQPAPAREGFPT